LVTFRLRAVARSDLLGIAVTGNVHAAPSQLSLQILPVKGLEWARPVAVAYRKDGYLSPAARRFVEILKEAVGRIAAGKT
jgi:DNA-binding transcriptional LysR family regulator